MEVLINFEWNDEDLEVVGDVEIQDGRTSVAVLKARLRGKIDILSALSEIEVNSIESALGAASKEED